MGVDIAVVGIGNILLSDDGVGVLVLNELKSRYKKLPGNVELIDGGTMGLDLLPFIEGKERVIFIDAVDFKAEPGTVGELNNSEIPHYFSSKLSVHQIALPDMIAAGQLLGTIPEEMCLIGIQPKTIETGYGLSPEIQQQVDTLIEKVINKLSGWGAVLN
ncbi:Hydrogenase maturation protease [hydrothermal vent metagenome]|uniref:Hydrogenase maturation protease n=1 Tax=hydrothermal vent metagenome TaxID=652676 RepID=A0A3B1DS58_9ZZZZ